MSDPDPDPDPEAFVHRAAVSNAVAGSDRWVAYALYFCRREARGGCVCVPDSFGYGSSAAFPDGFGDAFYFPDPDAVWFTGAVGLSDANPDADADRDAFAKHESDAFAESEPDVDSVGVGDARAE